MAFTLPTWDELTDFATSIGRSIIDEIDWSRFKSAWKWHRVLAGLATDFHAALLAAVDDLLPDRASEIFLARWADLLNVPRKLATPARGTDALRVFGEEAAVVAIGDTLTHQGTGLRYQITEAEAIGVGATWMNVSVIAIDVGAQTRLTAGEVLFFDDPPAGIQEAAELVLDLDVDGDDLESIEAWRKRIVGKWQEPPLGGARADYSTWAKQVTGVDGAYVYPRRQGNGSVDLAALHPGDGVDRLLSGGEIVELQAYVDAKRPVTSKSFRVLTVDTVEVANEITVVSDGEPDHEWYWTDQVPLEILTYDPDTRLATFTTDRPADMAAGQTIVTDRNGFELVIESVSGADAVVLELLPDGQDALEPGDLVYSGGPLVGPLREAIKLHYRELGPTNPDAAPYGPWEAQVRPSAFSRGSLIRVLEEAARAAAKDSPDRKRLSTLAATSLGARSTTTIQPAATVEPTDDEFPLDGTVHLAVPGLILVRREW